MSERLATATIGEIAAADVRAAAVFERFGIDLCGGGRRSLTEACRAANVDPSAVVRELEALQPAADTDVDATDWPIDRLIDHIVQTHHASVRSLMPVIGRYLAKLVEAHGARHPDLIRVSMNFDRLSADLLQHMLKEEQVLFPYLRELAKTGFSGRRSPSPFGTVENPIRMMEREHREATDRLGTIRELTGGHAAPSDGCAAYEACMAALATLERELHRHVDLENNVLYPKAVELENG